MTSRPVGNTSLKISPLTLGTMTFGGQTDEATARTMVDMCLERGINHLDTANVYNAGVSEEFLGRILAGRRDRFVIATKVGQKMGEGPYEQGLAPTAIRLAIDASLRRLNTEFVDLYYLHLPDYAVPIEQTLATMNELVQAGKVRHVAISNYASWQICKMLWLAEKNGWSAPIAVQPMYNLLARRVEAELMPFCREFGLAVIPYNPLAGGLLTGKHSEQGPISGTRFERMPIYRDRYWQAENFAAVQRLHEIVKLEARSLTRLAIRWVMDRPGITSVILGASRLEHLQENLAALDDPPLSAETLAACDEIWLPLRGISPPYNR
jgi:aryl-alcohol dehydrogenase-like predicted oxidoreductase